MPRLLRAIAGGDDEDTALGRVLHVIERIGGRTVYLALLNENGVARERLIELCAHSQFLTDQIAAFPLLLDELLDERLFLSTPTRAELAEELRARMDGAAGEDPEQQVDLLRQFQRAAMFRVAVPDLTGRLPLMKVSDRLTDIAELIVGEALRLSWAPDRRAARRTDVRRRRGRARPVQHDRRRLRQVRRHRTRLRLGPRSRVPARLARRDPAHDGTAGRRQQRVLPAAGAAPRAPAHRALVGRSPVRSGHAPAAERQGRPAGAEHRGLRRLPARGGVDLGTPVAAARARGGRRARRSGRGSSRCAATCCVTQSAATRCATTCAACASGCAPNCRSPAPASST